jgi:hypothetical protein
LKAISQRAKTCDVIAFLAALAAGAIAPLHPQEAAAQDEGGELMCFGLRGLDLEERIVGTAPCRGDEINVLSAKLDSHRLTLTRKPDGASEPLGKAQSMQEVFATGALTYFVSRAGAPRSKRELAFQEIRIVNITSGGAAAGGPRNEIVTLRFEQLDEAAPRRTLE